MLRLTEIGFFLIPFAAYAAWFVLGSRATTGVVVATALTIGLMAAATIWYGLERSLPPGQPYVPAQMKGGVIVEGHGR